MVEFAIEFDMRIRPQCLHDLHLLSRSFSPIMEIFMALIGFRGGGRRSG
jgi:hypothetical protein